MEGHINISVSEDAIDEGPMAYKSMKDIVDNIGDLYRSGQTVLTAFVFYDKILPDILINIV